MFKMALATCPQASAVTSAVEFDLGTLRESPWIRASLRDGQGQLPSKCSRRVSDAQPKVRTGTALTPSTEPAEMERSSWKTRLRTRCRVSAASLCGTRCRTGPVSAPGRIRRVLGQCWNPLGTPVRNLLRCWAVKTRPGKFPAPDTAGLCAVDQL